jgi:hypothetical protein
VIDPEITTNAPGPEDGSHALDRKANAHGGPDSMTEALARWLE